MHNVSAADSGQSDATTSAGLSRREVVGSAATGLALALFARAYSQAAAQEATPAAEGGLPPGMAVIPVINVPIPAADVPAGGFTLSIYRFTLEPKAVIPNSTFPFPASRMLSPGH